VALGGGDDSIDVSSGGYLYVSSLWLGDVTMSTSMDGGTGGALPGQAWTVNPAAAAVPVDDRQWIAAYGPQTVYLSYTDIGTSTIDVQKSTDAGKTFGPPVQVYDLTSTVFSDLQGNMAVDQYNGNLYGSFIPFGAHNQIYLFRSTDGGASFTLKQAYSGPGGTDNGQVFPALAVDRGGNVHIAFSRCNTAGHTSCQIYMVSSADQGDTWTPARQVSSGIATAVLPAIAAGSPGTVDVAWLGSAASTPDVPSDWHVFFAQTLNALSAAPTFTQVQAESAVMHDKSICFEGFGCPGDPGDDFGNRDLLEYFSMTIDPDGMANIAYPDSVTNCPSDTCITNTWFIKQTGGTSAYASPAPPASATFTNSSPITASPNNSSGAEPNAWVDSHNCIFAAAISGTGGPGVWKSTDDGASFGNKKQVLVGTGLHNGDFDIISVPRPDGSRPDVLYTADLGLSSVHIGKSTDGGITYAQPGTGGSAGEVSASSDRMWLAADRIGPDQIVYLMDHELASEVIRFSASVNDMPWVTTTGTTEPELLLPPSSTLPNTNPGPIFVNKVTRNVYGVFGASTITTNAADPPFGKEPNVWGARGAPPAAPGAPPGPFSNFPVFKGLIDSPATALAGTTTYGTHVAAIFPSADSDSAGNIYVVWAMNSARPNAVQGSGAPTHTYDIWFAASRDDGQTFYGPFRVSSGVGTSVFPWIDAGDDGRVDIVWYQSANVAPPLVANPTSPGTLTGGPNAMPAGSEWFVMFAQSLNADSREPVFTVSQASDHKNHTGSISIGGLTGSSDRSLLDFFEVAIGPDGKANIAYADNGLAPTHISYARQTGGPLALTSPTSPGCLGAPPPTPTPTPTTPAPTATPTATPPPTPTPTPPALPDLQVTNIFATNAKPKEGDRVTLTATISNAGSGNAGASKTEFLLDDAAVLGQIDTPGVPAGGSVNVSIAWETRGLNGTHTIRVTADKTGLIAESDENNNAGIFTATVQGNKVKNGSFEQANSSSNAPEGWSGSSTGAGNASWSDGGSDGNKSASTSGNGGNAATSGSPFWTSDSIAVTPGEVLTFVVSVQSLDASSAASAGLVYLGAAGNVLSTVNLITAPLTAAAFTKFEQTVTIPTGVAQVRVQLTGFAPTDISTAGTVKFDEVGLFGN
jgi:hypothetical protein